MSGKLTIVPDETETFTKSTCNCEFCESMHKSVNDWEMFIPTTILQQKMKTTIANIEHKIANHKYGQIKPENLRRSPRLNVM